jgi:hypothetical protein
VQLPASVPEEFSHTCEQARSHSNRAYHTPQLNQQTLQERRRRLHKNNLPAPLLHKLPQHWGLLPQEGPRPGRSHPQQGVAHACLPGDAAAADLQFAAKALHTKTAAAVCPAACWVVCM